MQFPFFHNRRKEILEEHFPDSWFPYLDANVHLYSRLEFEEKDRLWNVTKVLVREKNWEGCNGLKMTDEIRVTIAAQAALLIINIDNNYFPNVESILVYPGAFQAVEKVSEGRIVTERPARRLGEAWSKDLPVILSWPDVLAGGRNEFDGRNVVLHEFAHKLDNRDGASDGVPLLTSGADYEHWSTVMSREFQNLAYLASTGLPSLLDKYGAKNGAEFFAVTTECFFERPRDLRHYHPDLYNIFRDFYKQDPAIRF